MNSKALQNEKFHIENDAKMVPFAGFNMPMWYTSIAEEHICVRDEVGVFDVSHMGEFFVSGENSKNFLQMVTTNDINKLASVTSNATELNKLSGLNSAGKCQNIKYPKLLIFSIRNFEVSALSFSR